MRITDASVIYERETLSLLVLEVERQPAVTLDDFTGGAAVLWKTRAPELERGQTLHAQRRPRDRISPTLLGRYGPVEKGEIRAWRTFRVGIEEMVRADIVLIDAALHQAHPERARVEMVIVAYARRDGREVMNAGQLHGRYAACVVSFWARASSP